MKKGVVEREREKMEEDISGRQLLIYSSDERTSGVEKERAKK